VIVVESSPVKEGGTPMQQLLFAVVLAATSVLQAAAATITFDELGFPAGPFASTTFNGVTFSASGGGGQITKEMTPNGTFGLLVLLGHKRTF
jgi:hypothetical protein